MVKLDSEEACYQTMEFSLVCRKPSEENYFADTDTQLPLNQKFKIIDVLCYHGM